MEPRVSLVTLVGSVNLREQQQGQAQGESEPQPSVRVFGAARGDQPAENGSTDQAYGGNSLALPRESCFR